jgi:hypothetical protein
MWTGSLRSKITNTKKDFHEAITNIRNDFQEELGLMIKGKA